MSAPTTPTPSLNDVLTIPEVAQEAGVHQDTVRRWIKRGELVAHTVGRIYAIRRDDLEAFMRPAQTDDAELDRAVAYVLANAPEVTVAQRQRLALLLG